MADDVLLIAFWPVYTTVPNCNEVCMACLELADRAVVIAGAEVRRQR